MGSALAESAKRSGGKTRRKSSVDVSQREREQALLRQYHMVRSPELQEELVRRFMPLARSLAMRYRGATESLEDLIQVANLGLVKAIDGFDPGRGRPFTAYAVPTILGELRRHFRDHVWNLHLPRSLQERTMQVDAAVSKLTEQNGRFPSVAEIAEKIDASEEDVLDALCASEARRTVSLDAPRLRDDGESAPTVETVPTEELGYDTVEAEMTAEIAGLDDREWLVLKLRFGRGMNQHEIGQRLGVSQMQISRIMRKALRKLLESVQGGATEAAGLTPPDGG
jgi:RNA polymerase sigma-B factor